MANPYSPIGTNTGYIATADGNEDLITGFSRNIASFALPQYCPIKPVNRQIGLYLKFNPEPNFRLGVNPRAEAAWADGSSRKNGPQNQSEMEFVQYQTQRLNKTTTLTRLQVQQASWPVEAENAAKLAQLMMTLRVYDAHAALAAASYGSNAGPVDAQQASSIVVIMLPSTSTGAANNWSNGTPAQPNILASLLYAQQQICLASGGAVTADELCLVVSPYVASRMAMSAEIQQALIQSQFAGQLITGDARTDAIIAAWNAKYGLPTNLRGFPIVVDDTVADTTTLPGANYSSAGSFVFGNNEAYLVRRPKNHLDPAKGGIVLQEDAQDSGNRSDFYPVLSTLVMITKEEFTAESFEDPEDRIIRAHIATDYVMQVTSTVGAFKFTHVVS